MPEGEHLREVIRRYWEMEVRHAFVRRRGWRRTKEERHDPQ
jgi:hypothetical protein